MVAVLALSAGLGGACGGRIAGRLSPLVLRRAVVLLGVAIAMVYLWRARVTAWHAGTSGVSWPAAMNSAKKSDSAKRMASKPDIARPRVSYTVFKTPIGHCAVAWNGTGLVGVQLPEGSALTTARRMAGRFRGAVRRTPPPPVRQAIDAIRKLLRGGADELAAIELDLSGHTPFYRRVYEIARTIPAGET